MKYRILLLAAALLFATGSAAIKGNTLTAWQVASFRSAIAVVALVLLIPQARRGWSVRHLPAAASYAATMLLFVSANKLTTGANSIFLQSTAPLYMLFISPFLLHEKLRRSDMFLVAGVAAGMSLFFISAEPAGATAPHPSAGNILAAASGLTWALTVATFRVISRHDSTADSAPAAVVMGNLLAFAIAFPLAMPVGGIGTVDVASVLYLGLFQVALAYLCLTRGLRHVPAFEASTLLLLEPVMNVVITWLAIGERPAPLALAGGLVILLVTLANTWWQNRRPLPSSRLFEPEQSSV